MNSGKRLGSELGKRLGSELGKFFGPIAVLFREYVANLSNMECVALSFVLVPRPVPSGARGTHSARPTLHC